MAEEQKVLCIVCKTNPSDGGTYAGFGKIECCFQCAVFGQLATWLDKQGRKYDKDLCGTCNEFHEVGKYYNHNFVDKSLKGGVQ